LRRALYAAALPAAFRWNKALGALYARLPARGKPHKNELKVCGVAERSGADAEAWLD
jgi:transposase